MNGFKIACLTILAILCMAVVTDLCSEDTDAGEHISEDGFRYRIDNEYNPLSGGYIVNYVGHGKSAVTVPYHIYSHPMSKVSYKTFNNRDEITSIHIEYGISDLECIIYGCNNIKEIHIPYTVKKMGHLSSNPEYTYQTSTGHRITSLEELKGYTYIWDGVPNSHNLVRVDSSYDGPVKPIPKDDGIFSTEGLLIVGAVVVVLGIFGGVVIARKLTSRP